jgi:hypothetical protein
MELNTVKDHHREHIWISKIRKYVRKYLVIVAIGLAIVLVLAQTASAFKETATSNGDGFQRGAKDAGRSSRIDWNRFDDSCPKGHTSTFCEGYKQGYSERWHGTPENDT